MSAIASIEWLTRPRRTVRCEYMERYGQGAIPGPCRSFAEYTTSHSRDGRKPTQRHACLRHAEDFGRRHHLRLPLRPGSLAALRAAGAS